MPKTGRTRMWANTALILLLLLELVALTLQRPATLRKFYSRPLRYVLIIGSEDQESSATKLQDHQQKNEKQAEEADAEHNSVHHEDQGDKKHRGYKRYQERDDEGTGELVRANHAHHYKEEKNHGEKKRDDEDHYNEHHKDEHSDKSSEFGENGSHQKGHSTQGEHNIFKKDEYEKKHDFYDEFQEDDEHEEHGEHRQQHEKEVGDHLKQNHHEAAKNEENEERGMKHYHHHHEQKHDEDDHKNENIHHHQLNDKLETQSDKSNAKAWSGHVNAD